MSVEIEIWHNPKCSTSRKTLALLEEHGVEPKIVQYLKTPPTKKRLREVLKMLAMKPRELMRHKDRVFEELALADPSKKAPELIAAMVDNPRIIQRPVVIAGNRAAVGRPPENVLTIL